jgi:hypothetical protein
MARRIAYDGSGSGDRDGLIKSWQIPCSVMAARNSTPESPRKSGQMAGLESVRTYHFKGASNR